MARGRQLRSLVFVGALGFALIAAGCSASNDPDTWEDAEDDGNLRANYLRACEEAGTDTGDLDESEARIYCECSFEKLVEYYGGLIVDGRLVTNPDPPAAERDFEAFKAQESELRSNPEDVPADVRAIFTSCSPDEG